MHARQEIATTGRVHFGAFPGLVDGMDDRQILTKDLPEAIKKSIVERIALYTIGFLILHATAVNFLRTCWVPAFSFRRATEEAS